jgi:hypothetical protein
MHLVMPQFVSIKESNKRSNATCNLLLSTTGIIILDLIILKPPAEARRSPFFDLRMRDEPERIRTNQRLKPWSPLKLKSSPEVVGAATPSASGVEAPQAPEKIEHFRPWGCLYIHGKQSICEILKPIFVICKHATLAIVRYY